MHLSVRDFIIHGVPPAALLLGLQFHGKGLAFGASGLSRGVALAWAACGVLAVSVIVSGFVRVGSAPLSRVVLRLVLMGVLLLGTYNFWCSWPVDPSIRARLLLSGGSQGPDPASHRILLREYLEGRGVVGILDATMLELAYYAHVHLRVPASGLYMAFLRDRSLLAFTSPDRVAERVPSVVTGFLATNGRLPGEREFLDEMHRDLCDTVDVGGPASAAGGQDSRLDACDHALVGGKAAEARGVLCVLGGMTASWGRSRYHTLAAEALRIVGRGPDAGREWDLAAAGSSPDRASSLSALSRIRRLDHESLKLARESSRDGDVLDSSRLLDEALRTDRDCISSSDRIRMANVRAWVEKRRMALVRTDSRDKDWIELMMGSGDLDPVEPWSRSRALMEVARSFHALGDDSQARSVLSQMDRRFLDPYLRYQRDVFLRNWQD